MLRGQQTGAHRIGKHPGAPAARHFVVQLGHIAHAAAQHDDVRVEQIDDLRQSPGQPVGIADETCPRGAITRAHGRDQLLGAALLAPRLPNPREMIGDEARPAQPGFDAALQTTPTARPRQFAPGRRQARPGQRVVAPLPRHRITAQPIRAVDGDACPRASAQNHRKHHASALPRAVDRLADRQTVGIVVQAHRSIQPPLQVLQQRATIEHGGIGVADQPGNRRHRAGDRRAQRQPAAELPIGRRHQRGDGLDGRGIVTLRRVASLAQQKPPFSIERGHLDLGTAQVEAEVGRRFRPVHVAGWVGYHGYKAARNSSADVLFNVQGQGPGAALCARSPAPQG